MARQYYNTDVGLGTRGDNAEWFDKVANNAPIAKLNEDNLTLEDGSTITGPNGDEYVVTKKKKQTLEDLAKEKLKDEAISRGQNQLKQVGSNILQETGAGEILGLGGEEAAAKGTELLGSPFNSSMASSAGAAEASQSGWALGNIGSAGNYILPAAGAYGLYDLYSNRPENVGTGKGYLEGAASGAALGSYFGPLGAVAGGAIGLGLNAFGIGGKSRTKIEEDRRQALADQGITVPNFDTKEWEQNEAFKQSRKESDLKGSDIENAAQFYGINGYSKVDQAKKEAIAQKALDLGLIREHHGTIDLSMTPEYEDFLKTQIGGGGAQSTGGVDRRQVQAEAKKAKKKAALDSIMPTIQAETTQGPRYDINPGNLLNNPYL